MCADAALNGSTAADSSRPRLPIPQEQAMGRDVLIVLIGIVLPIVVLLFLAWHYLF